MRAVRPPEASVDSALEQSLSASFPERNVRVQSADGLEGSVDAYIAALDGNRASSEYGRTALYPLGHRILIDAQRQVVREEYVPKFVRALEFHAFSCTIDGYFQEAHDAYAAAIALQPSPRLYAKRAWVAKYLGRAESAVQDRLMADNAWPEVRTVQRWRDERND